MKFIRNSNIFIQENALENVVCEMASILSRPQCVNFQSGARPRQPFGMTSSGKKRWHRITGIQTTMSNFIISTTPADNLVTLRARTSAVVTAFGYTGLALGLRW